MSAFQNIDVSTPVVILHGGLGALTIMRSLGRLGVPIHCIADKQDEFSFRSRYCRTRHVVDLDPADDAQLLDDLRSVAGVAGGKPLLIATSDEMSMFVAEHAEALGEHFLIAQAQGPIVEQLANKKSMFELAVAHDVPVPNMKLPGSSADLRAWADDIEFPVMLKGIMGNRLQERTGKKMAIVGSVEELLEQYELLEDPDDPNLMVQELIPGDDDQVYIFNGYFDADSRCLAAFTGRKIRQFPVHTGCASLGECTWVQEVADLTIGFMQAIGYRGILDIGYRLDPRDGKYKVLDINPRVGQAFRLFVAENGVDVIRAQYLDITGQAIPEPVVPIEGRRWIIEDYDIVSSLDYWREGTLGFGEWLGSFRKLREGAWFSWRDPVPFLLMLGRFGKKFLIWAGKKLGLARDG